MQSSHGASELPHDRRRQAARGARIRSLPQRRREVQRLLRWRLHFSCTSSREADSCRRNARARSSSAAAARQQRGSSTAADAGGEGAAAEQRRKGPAQRQGTGLPRPQAFPWRASNDVGGFRLSALWLAGLLFLLPGTLEP